MGLVEGTVGGAALRIGNGGGAPAPEPAPWAAADCGGIGGACLCGDAVTGATSKSYTSFCGGNGGGGILGSGTSKPWK